MQTAINRAHACLRRRHNNCSQRQPFDPKRPTGEFSRHSYDYDPAAARFGLQAAEALAEQPSRIRKTLIVKIDGKAACLVLPSKREASMKKVAAALGGKSASMRGLSSSGTENLDKGSPGVSYGSFASIQKSSSDTEDP